MLIIYVEDSHSSGNGYKVKQRFSVIPFINKGEQWKNVCSYMRMHWETQKENRTPLLVSVDCTHLLSIKSQRFFVVPFTSTNIDRARVGRQKKRASKKLYNSFEGLVDRIRRDACCVFGAFFLSLSRNFFRNETRKQLLTKIHKTDVDAIGKKKRTNMHD